ncbi:MAG: PIG-L family deacetylase [Planctomycetia bacterium]|nr:PIG-L family deacetylase [Planctomycetia bacterium]
MQRSVPTPRVLAIHAHPDDVEFQCAGTLALLKQKGCSITVATMTPGDCGSAEMGCDEISAVRRAEAKAAADLLGADYVCLEFRDLSITHDNDARRRVTEVLRRVRPDIVMTAPPVDYMSDHEVTCKLLRDACFNASVPNYATRQWEPAPAIGHIPHLYFVDAIEASDWFGRPIEPEFILDISSSFDLKLKMLACHASQRNWLLKQHGIDEYLESCRRWSASRGSQIGATFGEAFTQYKGHPYPTNNLLRETLIGN